MITKNGTIFKHYNLHLNYVIESNLLPSFCILNTKNEYGAMNVCICDVLYLNKLLILIIFSEERINTKWP